MNSEDPLDGEWQRVNFFHAQLMRAKLRLLFELCIVVGLAIGCWEISGLVNGWVGRVLGARARDFAAIVEFIAGFVALSCWASSALEMLSHRSLECDRAEQRFDRVEGTDQDR